MSDMTDNSAFNTEKIKDICSKNLSVNILDNIDSYNDEMTISQVVRFFERHGLVFTKTMIQNYVRVGLIPPPVEKRYYLKKHLILLTIIDSLKEIYSLDEIATLFKPIMNDVNTFDDDIVDMPVVYKEFAAFYSAFVNDWIEKLPQTMKAVEGRVDVTSVSDMEKQEVTNFFTILMLMVHSIATKKIANIMMDLK